MFYKILSFSFFSELKHYIRHYFQFTILSRSLLTNNKLIRGFTAFSLESLRLLELRLLLLIIGINSMDLNNCKLVVF